MRRRGWFLTSSDHVVAEDVPAPPAEVRDFYCDVPNITRVHPLVVSVRLAARDQGDDARTESYRVQDRIKVGPFPLTVAYTARFHVPDHGDVLTEALQFPKVRLQGRVSFDEIDGGTRLTERLSITAPRPLAAMTVREAVKAHAELLDGIRRYFDR